MDLTVQILDYVDSDPTCGSSSAVLIGHADVLAVLFGELRAAVAHELCYPGEFVERLLSELALFHEKRDLRVLRDKGGLRGRRRPRARPTWLQWNLRTMQRFQAPNVALLFGTGCPVENWTRTAILGS